MNRSPNERTFLGVFLIGLAVLFFTGYWWPGILFVIGISGVARALSEGKPWSGDRGALVLIGLGIVFAIWDFVDRTNLIRGDLLWPIVLVLGGLYLLFGEQFGLGRRASTSGDDKAKRV